MGYRTVRDGTVPYGNVISYRWHTLRYRTVLYYDKGVERGVLYVMYITGAYGPLDVSM